MRYNFLVRMANKIKRQVRRTRTASNRGLTLNDLKGMATGFDQLARAQFIAGFLGDRVNAVRNPGQYLIKAIPRLEATGADPQIIAKWTDRGNKDFLGQSAIQIFRRIGGSQYGSANAEDVLTSIVTGLIAGSGSTMRTGPKTYAMGQRAANAGILYPLGATASQLGTEAQQLANDLARTYARRNEESGDVTMETSEGAGRETLFDQLAEELEDPETLGDLLFQPGNIEKIGPVVGRCLRNKRMQEIWELISDNPSLLNVKGNGDLALKRLETVAAYERRFGQRLDPNSVARTFKQNLGDLEECIKEAFSNPDVVGEIQFQRDLAWVLREERRRRASYQPRRSRTASRSENKFQTLANKFASFRL